MIAVAALALLVGAAQAESQVTPYGFVQPWFSSAGNGLDGGDAVIESGFGLRRARLGAMLKSGNFKGNVLVEGAGGFAVRDAYIEWTLNEKYTVTMGRFRGAGCQAAGLTSPVALDLPEYGLVGKNWAAGTVGADSRTVGMQLTVMPTKIIELKALLHNGSGNLYYLHSTAAGSFPGSSDTGYLPRIDMSAKVRLWPGTEMGMTYGPANENRRFGTDVNGDGLVDADELNADSNLSGHIYLNLGMAYAKFDYARLNYLGSDWNDGADDRHAGGHAFTAGYLLMPKTQLVLRYDKWDSDKDVADNAQKNLTFGLNYSFNESPFGPDYRNRVQLAFTHRLDETPNGRTGRKDNNLVQIMWTFLIR